MMSMSKKTFAILAVLTVFLFLTNTAHADPFKSTPYPVPRFVSLDADEVYVRTGPGKQYPIDWVFQKKGLPVEIILEYEHWRKIKDHEGGEGWVYGPLLSGKRTGLVKGEENVSLHQKPRLDSAVKAYIEPLAVLKLEKCEVMWCQAEAGEYKGWIPKAYIWGVYENEKFN